MLKTKLPTGDKVEKYGKKIGGKVHKMYHMVWEAYTEMIRARKYTLADRLKHKYNGMTIKQLQQQHKRLKQVFRHNTETENE